MSLRTVMKNWLPFVFGPALAMLSSPGFSCFNWKFSSGNVLCPMSKDIVRRSCISDVLSRWGQQARGVTIQI